MKSQSLSLYPKFFKEFIYNSCCFYDVFILLLLHFGIQNLTEISWKRATYVFFKISSFVFYRKIKVFWFETTEQTDVDRKKGFSLGIKEEEKEFYRFAFNEELVLNLTHTHIC